MRVIRGLICVCWCVALRNAAAQTQPAIPIRTLAPPDAVSATAAGFGGRTLVLSDGRVMVTEPFGKRVSLFDRDLASATVIVDSTALTAGRLPAPRMMMIAPFTADSILLLDVNGGAFLVLDPAGKTGRIMALPRAEDALTLSSPSAGMTLDPAGRLVYRGQFRFRPVITPEMMMPGGAMPTPTSPDSFPIVRADFDTRRADTIAVVHMPLGFQLRSSRSADGRMSRTTIRDPLPVSDDWAVLSDGSIAIVRGHDYHIDWIYADGTKMSSPKMPFDWRRLTDDDKKRMIDSVVSMDARMSAMMDSVQRARGGAPRPTFVTTEFVPASALPDYYPPVRGGTMMADRDARLWILPSTSTQARGGLLYDVVDRKGTLVERVQLPPACALAGFAPRDVVFLSCAGKLQRTRVVR